MGAVSPADLIAARRGATLADGVWDEGDAPPVTTEFVLATEARSAGAVGWLRILPNADLSEYDNVEPDLAVEAAVVDVGGFTAGRTNHPRFVHDALLGCLQECLAPVAGVLLYAQCRPQLLRRFEALGFCRCTRAFAAAGWQGTWVGILCELAPGSTR